MYYKSVLSKFSIHYWHDNNRSLSASKIKLLSSALWIVFLTAEINFACKRLTANAMQTKMSN